MNHHISVCGYMCISHEHYLHLEDQYIAVCMTIISVLG